jgi:5-methylcytosine-specific restriction endonuclease McrA
MRELVILRDRHCVFPWCATDARTCDLDHIVAYRPPDEGGPPSQTNPLNLAPLCRRHHRAKTFTGWTYRRRRDGTYTWTSPHGRTSAVGPDGTTATTAASLRALANTESYTLAT